MSTASTTTVSGRIGAVACGHPRFEAIQSPWEPARCAGGSGLQVCSATTTARKWPPELMLGVTDGRGRFRIARNPDPESRLPYLIWLPVEGGMVLKARDTWPRANRIFCAQDATPWSEAAELLEDVPVALCRRRGAAIDLVLDRPSLSRSQFVFTQARGRPASPSAAPDLIPIPVAGTPSARK